MDAQLARQLASTYRAILRIHRTQLPGPLRDVGDSFVRAEFGSVLKASKTSKAPTRPQLDEFLTHWEGYAAMLRPPASSDPASSAGHHAPAVEALRQVGRATLHLPRTRHRRVSRTALRTQRQPGPAILVLSYRALHIMRVVGHRWTVLEYPHTNAMRSTRLHAVWTATAVLHLFARSQVSEGLDEYLTAEQKLRVDSLKREAHDLGVSMLAKQASDTSEQPTDGKK